MIRGEDLGALTLSGGLPARKVFLAVLGFEATVVVGPIVRRGLPWRGETCSVAASARHLRAEGVVESVWGFAEGVSPKVEARVLWLGGRSLEGLASGLAELAFGASREGCAATLLGRLLLKLRSGGR